MSQVKCSELKQSTLTEEREALLVVVRGDFSELRVFLVCIGHDQVQLHCHLKLLAWGELWFEMVMQPALKQSCYSDNSHSILLAHDRDC